MRILIVTSALAAALAVNGCSRPQSGSSARDAGQRDSVARKAGRAAHDIAEETAKAARKAGRELREAAREAREGWKEAGREDNKSGGPSK